MAKKKEPTIEKKLRALYDLQLIDSRIDEIISLRGELPLEVEDLENEIKELKTKSDKIKAIVEENKKEILEQKQIIENAKELHKKYEEKLKNVRNNREYNSIVKEQEYQDLESQLAEKKINEYKSNIEQKDLNKLKDIETLVISVDSDVCFYPEEQKEFLEILNNHEIRTTYTTINSTKGHDSFLLEPELFEDTLKNFL